MREIKACVSASDFSFQWQISQKLFLVLSDDRGAESSRRIRHIVITLTASRVSSYPIELSWFPRTTTEAFALTKSTTSLGSGP